MPRAEAGSAKALSNKMKSKGLGKLRWYCQVCEKQCRDENGFQCHQMSESHLRNMLRVGESAGKHISDYTSRFEAEFVALLSRRWGTKRVRINQVYQEYISDKDHLHMNATRFLSLTEFAKHLGRTGVAHVDENEKGWWVSWIDTSPRALAKAAANQQRERGDVDDEMRQRRLIQEQIERARDEGERRRREAMLAAAGAGGVDSEEAARLLAAAAAAEAGDKDQPSNELRRDEGEKLSLNLSFKATPVAATSAPAAQSPSPPLAAASSSSAAPTPSTTAPAPSSAAPAPAPAPGPAKFIAPPSKPVIGFTPRAHNPLSARPNPLKASSSSSSSASGNPLAKRVNPLKAGGGAGGGGEKRKAPLSAVEQIAMEEMARKQRRMK